MSAPVFISEGGKLTSYKAGDRFHLCGTEGRHAGVVQRRQPGEAIDIVDGTGGRLRCVIESVDQSDVFLTVVEVLQEDFGPYEFILVQALAKGDRDEMAIEAATEVGVDVVLPWQAERSIVIWRGSRAAKSQARWVATVRTAAKQARRSEIPAVAEPVDSKQLTTWIKDTTAAGGLVVILHEDATAPLGEIELPAPPTDGSKVRIALVVGPEGGMSEREVENFTAAGAQLRLLGPHVLRTSTAGPVGLSLLSHLSGRWG